MLHFIIYYQKYVYISNYKCYHNDIYSIKWHTFSAHVVGVYNNKDFSMQLQSVNIIGCKNTTSHQSQ